MGTNEVIDKKKNKKIKLSLTQGVPVLSPPEARRGSILASNATSGVPSKEPETQKDPIIVTEEERYLRQIRYIKRSDGTYEIDPPDEIDSKQKQDQKLQEEFDQWQKDLEAYSRAHPEAAEPRPLRQFVRQVEDWRTASPPEFKEAHWRSPSTE